MINDGVAELVAAGFPVPVAQVSLAVGLGGEGVLALAALVRTLPVVRPHVTDQRPFVARTLLAHVAPVRRPRQVHPIVTCKPAQTRVTDHHSSRGIGGSGDRRWRPMGWVATPQPAPHPLPHSRSNVIHQPEAHLVYPLNIPY